jgi:hypothetical protein
MDRDFELGGRKFKLYKIDTFKQFHIIRRIGPILSDLLPMMKEAAKQGIADVDKMSTDEKLENIARFASPVMNGLSKLSDADAEMVLFGLLASVEVQQMPVGNWARVATPSMLMMQDLELPQLLNIASHAFMFNLSGFLGALPQ